MGSLAQRVVLLSGILAALTTGAARAWEFEGEQALNDALARGSPVLVARESLDNPGSNQSTDRKNLNSDSGTLTS